MTNYLKRSRVNQNRKQSTKRSLKRGGNPPKQEDQTGLESGFEISDKERARLLLAIERAQYRLGSKALLKDGVTEAAAIRHLRADFEGLPRTYQKQAYRPLGCKKIHRPATTDRPKGTYTCVSASAEEDEPTNCEVNENTHRCNRKGPGRFQISELGELGQ